MGRIAAALAAALTMAGCSSLTGPSNDTFQNAKAKAALIAAAKAPRDDKLSSN